MSRPTIRVLVVDDHAVVREGVMALLALEDDIEVVGEASDGQEAVAAALQHEPDLILLDLIMPGMGGLDVIQALKGHKLDVQILVLTSFSEEHIVFSAIKSGAAGYLLKDASPEALLRAIRDVHAGHSSLHPSIARKLLAELSRASQPEGPTKDDLTPRELEVLQQVAKGLTNQQIGQHLHLSEHTVRNHVSTILSKLHLANRTQAALYALRRGLASLSADLES